MSTIKEKLRQINQEIADKAAPLEAAGASAILEAFPGETRDVFALDPVIKIGDYEISPCFDYHIRVLALAEHPVYKMIIKGDESTEWVPILGDGHFLAWMFTLPVRELKELIEQHGVNDCRQLAEAKFEFMQPRAVMLICDAVINQINSSMKARLSYQGATDQDEKGKAQAKSPPLSAPLTASGG